MDKNMKKKLPIGIQTFKEIIDNNYAYIDKTGIALELIHNYKYAFLSRPRRFGKSLFLDTLHNIFEGKKELFENLAIYNKWDFDDTYPVIKISWGGDFKTLESTHKTAMDILQINQKRLGIECKLDDTPSGCFRKLIVEAYNKYQKPVVVLIDEYDKPILDNLENLQIALENRDFLRSFYVMLKENDAYIKFAFLTGISKFSKANIFSGLNNLEDISLTPRYATICGYTQSNIVNEFRDYFNGVDLDRVKEWYNGYNFLGESVYNPFDILKFIKNDFVFENYWWESGNPYFLITLLKQQPYNIPNLENITVGKELLNSFEVEKLRLEVLLFQSGYLTIDKMMATPLGVRYRLKVPNMEVQLSLNSLFLDYLCNSTYDENRLRLHEALQVGDMEVFSDTFTSLFASIPYNNYVKNNIGEYEGYYASVFYAYLAASGFNIIAEDVTNSGRIDITLLLKKQIYIIEFKLSKEKSKTNTALEQIKAKEYAFKYKDQNKNIYLLGIEFNTEDKNISSFEWEKSI